MRLMQGRVFVSVYGKATLLVGGEVGDDVTQNETWPSIFVAFCYVVG